VAVPACHALRLGGVVEQSGQNCALAPHMPSRLHGHVARSSLRPNPPTSRPHHYSHPRHACTCKSHHGSSRAPRPLCYVALLSARVAMGSPMSQHGTQKTRCEPGTLDDSTYGRQHKYIMSANTTHKRQLTRHTPPSTISVQREGLCLISGDNSLYRA
jgi:hypothetical protein